jgi:hypothetical protein
MAPVPAAPVEPAAPVAPEAPVVTGAAAPEAAAPVSVSLELGGTEVVLPVPDPDPVPALVGAPDVLSAAEPVDGAG